MELGMWDFWINDLLSNGSRRTLHSLEATLDV